MEQGLNNPGPLTIFLVFTAGLLTSLGPCSLSLLPITIAYVGGTKNNVDPNKPNSSAKIAKIKSVL